MEKNSFVLYTEDIDNLMEELSETQIGKLIIAINTYVKTKQTPDFKVEPLLSMAFKFIKNKLDRDIDKWEKTKQARSDAGKKGGAKKGNQNAKKEKSVDNYEEKQTKQTKQTNDSFDNQNKQKQTKQAKQPVNVNDYVNVNVNDNVNNKKEKIKKEKESQTQQPSAPAIVKPLNSQQRVYEYFASKYLKHTGVKYLSKRSDFISLSELIHAYGEDMVKQKIDWLEVGCVKRVFWFAKEDGINSFSIGKLKSRWNEILPMLTAEQLKAQEEKKKEEERMKRVLANVQKRKEAEQKWNTH